MGRFSAKSFTLSPQDIKQLGQLMVSMEEVHPSRTREFLLDEAIKDLDGEQKLSAAMSERFSAEAQKVAWMPSRSFESDEVLLKELSFRLHNMVQQQELDEARRHSRASRHGRYYRRKSYSLPLVVAGMLVSGASLMWLQRYQRAQILFMQHLVAGEENFQRTPCQLALGKDVPNIGLEDAPEALKSPGVYKVFASCQEPGFLYLQYEQSLPLTSIGPIPFESKAPMQLLMTQGKVLRLLVSGTQPIRIRYAFSQTAPSGPLQLVPDEVESKDLLWIREVSLPTKGGE